MRPRQRRRSSTWKRAARAARLCFGAPTMGRPVVDSPRSLDAPFLGVGVGLRLKHYPRILAATNPGALRSDFFEALSENYMVPGGRPLRVLADVRARFPIAPPRRLAQYRFGR